MSKSEYLEKFAHNPLTTSKVMLKTYKGELLVVLGETQSKIVYMGKQHYLPSLLAGYDTKATWLRKKLAPAH